MVSYDLKLLDWLLCDGGYMNDWEISVLIVQEYCIDKSCTEVR